MEIWRTVYEFPIYEISSSGRLVNTLSGRELTRQLQEQRYWTYILHFRKRRYERQAARLVAAAFIRLPRPGEIGRHINGNTLDDRVENLEWVQRRDVPELFARRPGWILADDGREGLVFKSRDEVARYFGVSIGSVRSSLSRGYRVKGYTLTRLE